MVEDLIRRARRRIFLNEALAQLAFAAAVLAAGLVLVLIFGTRYLEWWTLSAFAGAGVAVGAYRVYRRTPDQYTTAVRLDENAHLHDALSTALYFSRPTAGSREPRPGTLPESAAFRHSQKEQAEGAAAEIQLARAVPFVAPRSLYAMAALCVLASGLIALRYGIGHGLDLRAPITQLLFEDQSILDAKKAQTLYPKSQKWMEEAQALLAKLGAEPNPNEPLPGDPDALDKAIEQATQSPGDASGKGGKGESGKSGPTRAGEASKESPDGDPMDNGDKQANNDQSGQEGSSGKSGDAGAKSSPGKNGSPGSRQSLLSKLKDAVSSMLSKSEKEDNSPSAKSQSSAKNETPSGDKGQAGKGAQELGDSQSDAEGQPDANAQDGQQAQGRLNSMNQTPPQGGSGIGTQDGSKEIKAAAQLKAMGKISEIIGQRSATVSGETSVEVQSGSQKLHTAYSNTSAAHVETDGDVTRDEIPLALQAYVQQYFAQVRKTGTTAKTAGAK